MKNQKIFGLVLMTILFLSCGTISAQNNMHNQEKLIDKLVAKYKNNNSFRHISVLGCNLGNTYNVFSENLKKKGFKLVKADDDYWEGKGSDKNYSWKGKISGRDVGLQIDCCGKYIVKIWMYFACNSEEDCKNTFLNVLGSLNKKYGKYTGKNSAYYFWDKANAHIELSSVPGSYIVKGKKSVTVDYDDLIYQNWIEEYKRQVKKQKSNQERKAFDNIL